MKKLFLLGACLLALSVNPVKAQTANPDIVVVRVMDVPNRLHFVIVRGEGKVEEMEFAGSNSAKKPSTGEAYFKVYSMLMKEGYALQNTTTSASGYYSTLLFVKAPKP